MSDIVRTYQNNSTKMRRYIEKFGDKQKFAELKTLITNRNSELRQFLSDDDNGRRFNYSYATYISHYKQNLFVSLKQVSYDPVNRREIWELVDKKLAYFINVSREVSQLGLENIFINYVEFRYKGLTVGITNELYRALNINDGYQPTMRFFRLFSDYIKEMPTREEVKK